MSALRPDESAGDGNIGSGDGGRRWARVEEVFSAAVDAGDANADSLSGALAARERVLDLECAGDPALRREVETLLSAHGRTGPVDAMEREIHRNLRGDGPAVGDRFGKYIITEKLGGGGMGLLYAARDERLDRTLALKVLPSFMTTDPDATRRFFLEARAAAMLDHPNICAIHEIAESEEGRLFIAMPLYKGETLAMRIARTPLDVETALSLCANVSRGLAHAHARGIVHRDIKPANLYLLDDGTLKILDFGIAKVADLRLTSTGAIVGTLPYMSPEQASGDEVDRRTDLWSLGVVMHEMITGSRPFHGPSPESVITAILTGDRAPLAGMSGAGAVEHLLDRLLAKDPAERFADADAAAAAITATLDIVRNGPLWEGGADGPPIAPEGERRQVAVLAMQLGGFGALVERWAPEEVERAMQRVREAAAQTVARFGGVLHRFNGESLVCLFGVPATHEDDIVRGVRAARELHEWGDGAWMGNGIASPPLELRSGLCAGSVVIQPDPATRTHRVAGEPLDAASRLAVHAGDGEILVGPECGRGLEAAFELGYGTPLALGARGTVATPRTVINERTITRAAAGDGRMKLTPFAGRQREFMQIREALALARTGAGQCVTIEAEAGAGKSRLLFELARCEEARDLRMIRVWCRAHHLGARPYEPFIAALRGLVGLHDEAGEMLDAGGIAETVAAIVPDLPDAVPLVLHLLGAPTDKHPLPRHLEGDRFRPATRDTLAALFTLATQQSELGIVFEDWHWADEASHEVLKQLVELAPSYPLTVVVSYRPEHGVGWPAETLRTSIRLGPFDAVATASVVAAVVHAEHVSDELVAAVHERSGGNPFFVEELSQALVEQGAVRVHDGRAELTGPTEDLHLPGTIQAVIRTRLDRLDAGAREVARAASVLGRDFTLGLVRQLIDAAKQPGLAREIERLRAAGLVHQTRVAPDPAYRFKHILTQEVVYDTLLAHRRRALHARAAAALESLEPARQLELVTVLALHHSRAESWPDAVRHGREEARQAGALGEFPRALRVMERLAEWAQRIGDPATRRSTHLELLLEQERLCETLGHRERQQEILARLGTMLDPAKDQRTLAEVSLRQGDLHVIRHQFDEARRALDAALGLSRAAGVPELTRTALRSLGLLCWHAGRSREGLAYLDEALVIDRELGATDQVARDLYNKSTLYKALGDLDAALRVLHEAGEMAMSGGDPSFLAYIKYNTALIDRLLANNDHALALFREAAELYRANGLWLEISFCSSAIGNILMERGDMETALGVYREAVAISRRLHHAEGQAQSQRILGTVLLGLGRSAEALPSLREAAALFARLHDRDAEQELQARIAAIEETHGSHAAAAAAWLRARDLRREGGNQAGELEAIGRAARALRDSDGGSPESRAESRAAFREAIDLAGRLEDGATEGELRNAAGILEWRAGQYADALAHYERARAIFRLSGDARREGLALNSIGATLLCLQRVDEARARLEDAVALNHAIGEELLEAHALAALGDALLAQRVVDGAAARYESSLALRRRLGDRRGEGWMLLQLAKVAEQRDDAVGAEERRVMARRIAEEIGDRELALACG